MKLAAYRKQRNLSQLQCARELGLTSKSYMSQLETGAVRVPVKLALKIQQWSGGAVTAAELSPEAAALMPVAEARA